MNFAGYHIHHPQYGVESVCCRDVTAQFIIDQLAEMSIEGKPLFG